MTRRLKRILYSIGLCSALSFVLGLWCGRAIWRTPEVEMPEPLGEVTVEDELLDSDDYETVDSAIVDYDQYLDTMPESNMVKLHVRPIGGSLGRIFNDSNHVHLDAAQALGIAPVERVADAWRVRRPVVKVHSNNHYVIDRLTHSLPYLVPEAAALLDEIGTRFTDSLASRGGGDYRVKVTSVLRTPSTVKRLRRVNRNATSRSAHQFGTTFDISYVNFACGASTSRNRTQQDLKNLLAEVLYDLRNEGRCYVKYERKQGCFHITVRPDKPAEAAVNNFTQTFE